VGSVPIDVAVLGCAHPHLPDLLGVLASEPDLRLTAAWDADPSAIPVALAGTAVHRAETAIRRADAVVVCAPTDQRPALCVQAARAGRPVLVAQPIALSAADARALVREVARTRTPAVPAMFVRELPALARLRGVVTERLLGRLSSVVASYTHPGALDGWFTGPTAWMRDPARAGVGGFGDLALQLVDALSVLPADEPPVLAAVALDRDGSGRADVGGVALGTWAGVPLTVRAGWATRPGGLELTIAGAARTATLRDGVLELAGGRGEGEGWVGAPPDAAEALRAFAARLRSRRFPRDGLLPAVRAQAIVEAAVPVD
jgi:predicted dehydrogenase